MDKKLVGALITASLAVGAVGGQVVRSVLGSAPVTYAHAWDVRREVRSRSVDAGVVTEQVAYTVRAWFSQALPDGGVVDLGPGRVCTLDQAQLAQQAAQLAACAPQTR